MGQFIWPINPLTLQKEKKFVRNRINLKTNSIELVLVKLLDEFLGLRLVLLMEKKNSHQMQFDLGLTLSMNFCDQ